MHTHLKQREYYEDIYDSITVNSGRRKTLMFTEMHDEFFKIMPNEPKNSHRAVLHLNLIYAVFVGSDLLERYDSRESRIDEMMAKDSAKDELMANARLTAEPKCQHCEATGLRITEKTLHHRKGFDEPEEVLFMLKCSHCSKNSAAWEDGTALEHRRIYCPKCRNYMEEKDVRKDKVITTTYTCTSCGHTYQDKLDLRTKPKPDPDFEADKAYYCLTDEKIRQELRDAKWRYEQMAKLGKEFKEKEENKHIYAAIKELKKPKIAELVPLLAEPLEKAGYIEFSLDKPEIGKDVFVGFSCLDNKTDRDDYVSQKDLQKLIAKVLAKTNWRLMSDGISYRLGYLSGRLRAYEREEDLKTLIMKGRKLSVRSRDSNPQQDGQI